MTIQEFDNTAWHAGMRADYKGLTYRVASVNFHEKLIALEEQTDAIDVYYGSYDDDGPEDLVDNLLWVRCENCILKGED